MARVQRDVRSVYLDGTGPDMPLGHKPLPDCLTRNVWSWIFEGAKDN
jgi:hypothetical protein